MTGALRGIPVEGVAKDSGVIADRRHGETSVRLEDV